MKLILVVGIIQALQELQLLQTSLVPAQIQILGLITIKNLIANFLKIND